MRKEFTFILPYRKKGFGLKTKELTIFYASQYVLRTFNKLMQKMQFVENKKEEYKELIYAQSTLSNKYEEKLKEGFLPAVELISLEKRLKNAKKSKDKQGIKKIEKKIEEKKKQFNDIKGRSDAVTIAAELKKEKKALQEKIEKCRIEMLSFDFDNWLEQRFELIKEVLEENDISDKELFKYRFWDRFVDPNDINDFLSKVVLKDQECYEGSKNGNYDEDLFFSVLNKKYKPMTRKEFDRMDYLDRVNACKVAGFTKEEIDEIWNNKKGKSDEYLRKALKHKGLI